MSIRVGSLALASTLLVAGVVSALGVGAASTEPPTPSREPQAIVSPHGPSAHGTSTLPPGHPPIGDRGHGAPASKPVEEPAALSWKAPATWTEAKSPSSFRLATYRIPHVAADTEDAELAVSRAGGSTSANLDRWVAQFDDAGRDERTERTVRGMKVTIVEVGGTYVGGAMTPDAPKRQPGQRLLGAIVETKGSAYFFKLVGPAATVRAARPAFDAMIAALAPLG